MTSTLSRELREFIGDDYADVSALAESVFGDPDKIRRRAAVRKVDRPDPEDVRLFGLREQSNPNARHDPVAGVVRDVLVVDPRSTNGRSYSADALRNAIRMYEGANVYIDHPSGAGNARKVGDRFARLRGVYARNDGSLWAKTLVYNPAHSFGKSFAWTVDHEPDMIGLSHNADGHVIREQGRTLVKQITRVHSVDLVDKPAHGRGLFG